MYKTITLSLLCIASLSQANEYQKNLQVFTVNTAEHTCTTQPHLVYKGDKVGYGKEIAKHKDDLIFATLGGAQTTLNGGGALGGLVVGIGVLGINSLITAATGDNEYLYVTECNTGTNKTRLMTLVVSNDKMSEAQWIAVAKKDQLRGGK